MIKQIDDECVEKIVKILDSYERMTPQDMEESAKFWITPLGLEFSWAATNDTRRVTTCKHADFYKPKPFFTHLHRKNHVDCLLCGIRRQSRHAHDTPTTCDLCGTKGIEEFYTFLAQAGIFIILGNICSSCEGQHKQTIESLFRLAEELEQEEGMQDEPQDS